MDLKYKFSGHQTFTFRYGWLEKGVRGLEEKKDLFFRDDAFVKLGVGKNMVESIRHWCQVAQLIEPDSDAGKTGSRSLRPTGMARKLLLNGAWDPFLEDDASLWLTHWLIATNPSIGTAWQILFSRYNRPDFTRREDRIETMSIQECLYGGRFRRSTHLEKDFVAASYNGDYIVTPTARDALRRLAEGIGNGSAFRAWTLTGPYGVGKSAFAVFLTQLLCSQGKQGQQARTQLEQADPQLTTRLRKLGLFGKSSKGFLPVLATARRTSASKCLAEGVVAAASSARDRAVKASVRGLVEKFKAQRNGQPWDTRQVVEAISSLSEAATASGYHGVLQRNEIDAFFDALLSALTPKERKQAEALADRVRACIHRTAKDATPRTLRVAMLSVMKELET